MASLLFKDKRIFFRIIVALKGMILKRTVGNRIIHVTAGIIINRCVAVPLK